MTLPRSDQLVFRSLRMDDGPRLVHLCNDETLIRNTSRLPYPYTLADAVDFLSLCTDDASDNEIRFAVCRGDLFIACTGAAETAPSVFELGYWVGRDYRGAGVATEMARAICEFLFSEAEAREINAGYFVDNPASGAVMTKLGFQPTGERIMTMSRGRGAEVETIRMTLSRDAFRNHK